MTHRVTRLTFLLVTFLLLSSGVFAEETLASRVNLGFGAAVRDRHIVSLLQRHGVVPHAAFLWTAGLTGTYRTFEAKSPRTFLREARAQAIDSFQNGLQGNQHQLQHFVAVHTEDEVLADQDLQGEARSLLNSRAALTSALDAAQKGEPLIYALEVSGETAAMQQLIQDTMVKMVERGVGGTIEVP